LPYATQKLIIAAPPAIQIAGSGISPAGQDQGFNVYTMENVAANTPVDITVSGTAPMPAGNSSQEPSGGAGADNSQNASVNSRASDSGADAAAVSATAIPARLDSLKWVLTGGFASIFVLGFVYLWMRPQAAGTQSATLVAAAMAVHPPPTHSAARLTPAASAATLAWGAAGNVADIHREVSGSMDELKDRLFRLELRHQAGTIAEEDYLRERARFEQTIRGLVQG
jgi:hypothetical protein